jgi:hypothetical protein
VTDNSRNGLDLGFLDLHNKSGREIGGTGEESSEKGDEKNDSAEPVPTSDQGDLPRL